jgi:hypothetical protein
MFETAGLPSGGRRGAGELVAILIIGILAAIALPSFLGQRDKGYESSATLSLTPFGARSPPFVQVGFRP